MHVVKYVIFTASCQTEASTGPNEGIKGVEKKTKVGRKKVVPVTSDPLPDVKVIKKRGTKSAALTDGKKVEAAAAAKPAQRGRKNKTPPVEEAEEVILIAEGGAAEGEITRPRKRVAKVSRAPRILCSSDQVQAEKRRRAWSDLATWGHDCV